MKKLLSATLITALTIILPSVVFADTAQSAETNTAAYFNKIKNDPNQLLIFLNKMPKGGELHYHLSGGTYAENLFKYGMEDNACINPKTFYLTNSQSCPIRDRLNSIYNNMDEYEKVINAWSIRNSDVKNANTTTNAHYHFFDTFLEYNPVVAKHRADILAEDLNRAGTQHEDYMELMIMTDNAKLIELGNKIQWNNNFVAMEKSLQEQGINKEVAALQTKISAMDQKAQKIMMCGTDKAQPGCKVLHKYLYLALRIFSPQVVFTQLYTGFKLASQDPNVVGINMVGPEDSPVADKDYDLHMRMVGYLHQQFPNVHISLHAGEMRTGLSTPKQLTFHIRDALNIAHAQRIGHGVDIAHEANANQLLSKMAKKHILVETQLTSNADLLGVTGNKHPLMLWLNNNVPAALSTDDEGVLRTDLTHEFERAILTYHLTYPQVKEMVRNVLTYSFLPGKSLWQNYQTGTAVSACSLSPLGSSKESSTCKAFLSNNLKAKMQWQLENEFNQFEKSYA